MNRIGCIHQPPFAPWLGIAESMLVCDVFVVYDDVQFEQGGWQNRNKIKTGNGPAWLTVPIRIKGKFGQVLREVEIAEEFNPTKMLRTIEMNYGRAPFFSAHFPGFVGVLSEPETHLVPLNVKLLEYLKQALDAKCEFIYSSSLTIGQATKTVKLVRILEATNCDTLYSGSGTKTYYDDAEFRRHNMQVVWHEYEKRHAVYPQQYMKQGFIPGLCFLDMLFNCGGEAMREILLQSGNAKIAEYDCVA